MTPQPQPADRCPARPGAPGYPALAATVDEAATKPGPYTRGQRRPGVSCSLSASSAPRRPRAAHAEAATA